MTPRELAINDAGGPTKVAAALGVSAQAVCFWRDGKRRFPVEFCAPLEMLCGRAVRRWDLRPDDWHRIWPELIGTAGAPDVPASEPATQEAA